MHCIQQSLNEKEHIHYSKWVKIVANLKLRKKKNVWSAHAVLFFNLGYNSICFHIRGSEEAVPGPSVFPSGESGVSGDFWVRKPP